MRQVGRYLAIGFEPPQIYVTTVPDSVQCQHGPAGRKGAQRSGGDVVTERRELETLVDARPDLVATLDHLLDVDAEQETWDPAAVDIEPDTITTLVDGGYVEATANGYRVSDRAALRTAVNRHRTDTDHSDRYRVGTVAALGVALALLIAVHLLPFGRVFLDGWVVLLSNDPYFYRYFVEQPLAGGPIPTIPQSAVTGEPLLVAVFATATTLLGGGPGCPGRCSPGIPSSRPHSRAWPSTEP